MLIKTVQLLLSLSILVIIHELGHFIAARMFKTRVEKFYLFFDFLFPVPLLLVDDHARGRRLDREALHHRLYHAELVLLRATPDFIAASATARLNVSALIGSLVDGVVRTCVCGRSRTAPLV